MAAMEHANVEFIAALPDITTSNGLLWPISRDRRFRLVRLCKEDEGVSICAALAVCGKRSVLLMQHTGFLDSINAIRAIAVEFEQPVCMLVGLQGKEPDRASRDSLRYGVRIIEPVIDAMQIDRLSIEQEQDVARLAPAISRAYDRARPFVALIGREVRI